MIGHGEYEPIGLDPLPPRIAELRAQWDGSPRRLRIVLRIYLVTAAWGGLFGGAMLTTAYSNWITWSVSLLILEPIGITSLAALIFFQNRGSWIGGILEKALRRAQVAMLIVGTIFVGFVVLTLLYCAVELWKLR